MSKDNGGSGVLQTVAALTAIVTLVATVLTCTKNGVELRKELFGRQSIDKFDRGDESTSEEGGITDVNKPIKFRIVDKLAERLKKAYKVGENKRNDLDWSDLFWGIVLIGVAAAILTGCTTE